MNPQNLRGESGEGVSQRVEMTKHPNSPPPIWNENDVASDPSRTTIAEEVLLKSFSFSFFL